MMNGRSRFSPQLIWIVAIALIGAILPVFVTSNFWLNFLTMSLFFAFVGQAWNVLGGYAGQFSFGHAAFFGTGAYAMAVCQVQFGINAWPAAVIAMAAAALVGAIEGFLSFRYGLRGSYFALITLAFAEVLRVIANTIELTGAGAGILIPLDLDPAVLQFADKRGFYYLILILVIGSMLLVHALENSRFGAWLTAIRENEDSAQALGVDTFRCKLGAITLSAAMMGLGGVFYAQLFLYLDAGIAYGPWISVEALLVPIIGGLGTVFGPILGSFVVHGLGESAKSLTDGAPGLSLVLYGILLILILRFLPSGLLGLLKSSWGKLSARRNPNDSASTSSQAQEAGDD